MPWGFVFAAFDPTETFWHFFPPNWEISEGLGAFWFFFKRQQNLVMAFKRVTMAVTLGQQCNVGEKPTVILYTYIGSNIGSTVK